MSYVIPGINRIYFPFFLCLCFTVFLVPQLAYADFASGLERELQNYVNADKRMNEWRRAQGLPTGTSYNQRDADFTNKSNSIGVKTTGTMVRAPANMPATVEKNLSKQLAKSALGGAIGGSRGGFYGGLIGAGVGLGLGIQDWMNNNGYHLDDEGYIVQYDDYPSNKNLYPVPSPLPPISRIEGSSTSTSFSPLPDSYSRAYDSVMAGIDRDGKILGYLRITPSSSPNTTYIASYGCYPTFNNGNFQGAEFNTSSNRLVCYYSPESSSPPPFERDTKPVPEGSESNYEPQGSDLPALEKFTTPEQYTYDVAVEPVTVEGPVTTNYDASGNPTGSSQVSTEYSMGVFNNQTYTPEMTLQIAESVNTYSPTGQPTGSTTTVTTDKSPLPVTNPPPQTSTGGGGATEIPTGCALFDPFCQWAKWTQEAFDEPEVEFADLIEDQEDIIEDYEFTFSASAQCPEPISINLPVVNTSVELKYDLLCSYVEMINPIIITAAWILAAFIYLGVLRRG